MIRSVDSLPSGIREKLHTKHTNTEENNTNSKTTTVKVSRNGVYIIANKKIFIQENKLKFSNSVIWRKGNST